MLMDGMMPQQQSRQAVTKSSAGVVKKAGGLIGNLFARFK
jgi:hypothetical protein